MKKYVGILAFIVFIIAVILLVEPLEVGDKTPTPISPLIPTATPTVEVLPTIVTPTATKTVTPIPSATSTPTSTSTVVPTKVVIDYPTPMPTPLGHFFYTIERGDNLWNIAVWVYEDGTKYVWICDANNLMHDCSLIHAGNVLWIPGYFKE